MQAVEQMSPSWKSLQELPVDARFIVEAFGIGKRGQLDQVPVAGLVLREQYQVIIFVAALGARLFLAARPGHVEFAADDGLDFCLEAFLVEFQGPEQVAVIGDGHSGHAQSLGAGDEARNARGTVKE